MKKSLSLQLGLAGGLFFLFLTLLGPYLPGVDINLTTRSYYKSFFNLPPYPPSADFWLGSDRDGRDIYSALIIGTRQTLLTVGGISILVFLLALPLGIGAAHFRVLRWMLRGWNYFFSRIPLIFFVIFVATIPALVFSPNRFVCMLLLIVMLEVGKTAEVIQKNVSSIHRKTYFEAAVVSGTGIFGLCKWYYTPICFQQWLSMFFTHIGSMLFLIGQLGVFNIFLSHKFEVGNGWEIVNTATVWPVYLTNIITDIKWAPWIPLFASCMMMGAMLSFFAIGEGIRKQSLLLQEEGTSKESSSRIQDLLYSLPFVNRRDKSSHS
jgi:peptide/nickel transport system permease protein